MSKGHGSQSKCMKVNVIPIPWASVVIEKNLIKTIRGKNIKLAWCFVLLCVVIIALGMGLWIWNKGLQAKGARLLARVHTQQQEYLTVLHNMNSYKSLVEFPNDVAVYVQWWGISNMLEKQGAIVSSVSYDRKDLSILPSSTANSIVVETGKGLSDLDVVGVWTIVGRLAPNADKTGTIPNNAWLLESRDILKKIFNRLGVDVYVDFLDNSSRGESFTLAVLLWKNGGV